MMGLETAVTMALRGRRVSGWVKAFNARDLGDGRVFATGSLSLAEDPDTALIEQLGLLNP